MDGVDDLQVLPLTEKLLAVLGKRELLFLEDVPTSMFPLLQWMATYLHTYKQPEKDMQFVGGCVVRIWESWRRIIGKYNNNSLYTHMKVSKREKNYNEQQSARNVCVCVHIWVCIHVQAIGQPQVLFLQSLPPCSLWDIVSHCPGGHQLG